MEDQRHYPHKRTLIGLLMNKSAGVLLGIVVAVAAVHTAGAWYTGKQLDGVLNTSIQSANKALSESLIGTDSSVKIELVSLATHLYSSEAHYRVLFKSPTNKDTGEKTEGEFLVVDHIEHGPLPFSRLKSFKLLPVMSTSNFALEKNPLTEKWFAATKDAAPLKGQVTLGYDRAIDSNLELLPLDVAPDKDSSVKFSGLNLTVSASAGAEKVKIGGYVDSFVVHAVTPDQPPVQIELNGFTLASDLTKDPRDFYLGGSVVVLKETKVVFGEPQSVLTMKNFEQKDNLQANGDAMSGSLAYNIGEIGYNGKPVGSAKMLWTLSNLNIPAIKSLADFYQTQLQPAQQAAAARGETPDFNLSDADQAKVKGDIAKVLEGKPQFALENLSLKTTNGESRMSLAIDLTNPTSVELPPIEVAKQTISQLKANVSVSKPMISDIATLQAELQGQTDTQAITQQASMMSEMASGMALSTQLARLEGTDIVSSLNYANGQVDFNGQKMTVEAFISLIMSKLGGAQG